LLKAGRPSLVEEQKMDWGLWIGFVAASAVMGLVPGPAVISIVGYALGSGRRTALASAAGMAVGNAVAITLSLAGVGAVLAASALAFSIVKWAGALYLVALGLLTIFRSRGATDANIPPPVPITPRAAFASNMALGIFHPKTIVFFIAFVPQFISPNGGYFSQAAMLAVTFCLVVAGTDSAYALAAARAAHLLRKPRAALWSKRAGGGALIAAGIATAATRG
jgi:threonine/homoserine/homoserine lactone efflux protein